MKVLMIAPEPFFQPRGTPFSEYYRIRCLGELGHRVDLVTYPIGEDVEVPGLRIFRTRGVPGIGEVAIGPSWAKLPLDALLFGAAWRRLAAGGYDLIHSHEEAGIMGAFLSRLYRLPHIYDMHSSLPHQLETFGFTRSRLVRAAFDWMETTTVSGADAVIAICPALVRVAKRINPRARVTLIENTAESHAVDAVPPAQREELRRRLGLAGKKVVLYTGTFEAYQGLELLLEAAAILAGRRSDAVLVLVGGQPRQVEQRKLEAEKLGAARICRFTGQVPHTEVPPYLKLADALVSPRSRGENTPLKIYSYLRAGAPIVATDLPTHTQVLGDDVALLAPPEPEPFAAAIERALDEPGLGGRLAANALRLSEARYSYGRYVEKTRRLYEEVRTPAHG